MTHAHSRGVELASAAMRIAASNLYSSPARLVRNLLFVRENQA